MRKSLEKVVDDAITKEKVARANAAMGRIVARQDNASLRKDIDILAREIEALWTEAGKSKKIKFV